MLPVLKIILESQSALEIRKEKEDEKKKFTFVIAQVHLRALIFSVHLLLYPFFNFPSTSCLFIKTEIYCLI